jgi:hypothetical protein
VFSSGVSVVAPSPAVKPRLAVAGVWRCLVGFGSERGPGEGPASDRAEESGTSRRTRAEYGREEHTAAGPAGNIRLREGVARRRLGGGVPAR